MKLKPWPTSGNAQAAKADHHFVEYAEDQRDYDREAFDRLRYAAHILRILKPKKMRVAMYAGQSGLKIHEGRQYGPREGRWAIVSIPPDASRAHIALSLAKLAGRDDEPYLLDLLMKTRPT
jgi:hypothetical protein